ncbi:MAG: HAD family hydrolase [Ancrocorticia sp.]|jgi:Cof subfamily protein (haloacid dehalogenase superfamily)|nr:HAD family hydrolase [Ancrocorticia sp.]MCI1932557.1 HAD family hydrolase [Ancrocorticia sp.]
MGRAIFFDVDGTILTRDQKVTPTTRSALRSAAARGHTLLLCTGRCDKEIYPWLWQLGFTGLVGSNGAYVKVAGRVVQDVNFRPEEIQELARWFTAAGAGFIWQSAEALYPAGTALDRFRTHKKDAMPGDWSAYAEQITPYVRYETPRVASKVSFVLPGSSGLHLADVVAQFGERFTIVAGSMGPDGQENGELSPRGMDKSVGLKLAAHELGVPLSDTVAIGDSANDVTMIKAAGLGIAMGNGTPEAKKAADWVTDSIDDDGVATALRHFQLV